MSATIDVAVESTAERSARATRDLRQALGLDSVKMRDLPLLTIALAEEAAREARENAVFRDRLCSAFRALEAQRPTQRARKRPSGIDALVAVGPIDLAKLRPSGALDPYALYAAVGPAQSHRVLSDLMLQDLKQSAALVERRNPGTAPASRRAKKALVEYIVEHMVHANL